MTHMTHDHAHAAVVTDLRHAAVGRDTHLVVLHDDGDAEVAAVALIAVVLRDQAAQLTAVPVDHLLQADGLERVRVVDVTVQQLFNRRAVLGRDSAPRVDRGGDVDQ